MRTSRIPSRGGGNASRQHIARAPTKLTAPRPVKVYPRTRLFKLLDVARQRAPIIWISAPAGAGKTTLVASYLRARKLRCLWYQIDAGDADPASFFHYLGIAAHLFARRRHPLPELTPEYLHGLPAFTSNFFRELFARMKPAAVLVLDAYEAIESQALLHVLLAKAFDEIPNRVGIVIVSRADPPPPFARWLAAGKLIVVDWEALKLRLEETRGICRLRTGAKALDADTALRLQDQIEGWMAGLILVLAQAKDGTVPEISPEMHSHNAIFDYFAAEIFDKSAPDWKDVLLKTALLPHIDPSAARTLTANPEAELILAELARKNYFIYRLSLGAYQYHALFRRFLLRMAQSQFTAAQWRTLQRETADVLIDAGQYEDAAAILQAAGDSEGLTRLIYQHAQSFAATGRGGVLEQWLRSLSPEWIESRPWLSYWLGVCRLPFDRTEARARFTRAYTLFKRGDEVNAWLLAWCGIIDSVVFEWGDFKKLDPWLEELERVIEPASRKARADVSALVAVSAFVALMSRRPDYPDIARWMERAWAVAMHAEDPTLRAKIAPHLLIYFTWWIGDVAKAGLLLDTLRPLMDREHTAPLVRTAWYAMAGGYHWVVADNRTCLDVVEKGLAMAEASGVRAWVPLICSQGIFMTLSSGDDTLAEHYLLRMANEFEQLQTLDRAMYYYLSAWRHSNKRRFELSREHAKTALELAETTGAVFHAAVFQNDYARALLHCGDERGAREMILAARAAGRAIGARSIEYITFLVEAEIALVKGDDEACREALRACLAVSRQQAFLNHPWWNKDTMCRLYVKALEWRIEPDYVRHMIRHRRLTPAEPPLHLDNWPWPAKLYTLGHFSILLNDTPVKFNIKSQKKPLELLKCIVAMGGRDVPEDKLAASLWPETDGDASAQSLTITLHRLRKLIGDDAVERQEGRIALNPSYIWVDVWAFERQIADLENACRLHKHDDVVRLSDKILELYRGSFLEGASDAPWALSMRERLRGKCLRLLESSADCMQQAKRHDLALACYRKAIEMDPLAEGFYRGLMQCYHLLGRRAEAVATYRRCREVLARELTVTPSAQTEALYRQILA